MANDELSYEDLVRMIGNEEIFIEDIEARQCPLWVHHDFSLRLVTWPKHLWLAFVYDKEWGLVLVRRWMPDRMRAIIYRGIDPVNAAILVQYIMARPMDLRGNIECFTSSTQVAMTGIDQNILTSLRTNCRVPFPPGRPTKAERMAS